MTTTFHLRLAIVRGLELIQLVRVVGISGARVGSAIFNLGILFWIELDTVELVLVVAGMLGEGDTGGTEVGKNLSNTHCSIFVTSN